MTPKTLPGSCSSLKAVTNIYKFRHNSLTACLNLDEEHQGLTPRWVKFYQTGLFMCAFKNNAATKFERAVMITKTKHLVHQKCGETTNCALTSIQGNLQDCKFLTASCLIMSRSPELESKCIKVLHPHALCCSSTPQNKSHAKTNCSAYASHIQNRT